MDYSQTVNLPKTDFPMKADLPKREPVMLEQWEKEKVYEQALAQKEEASRNLFCMTGHPTRTVISTWATR